VKSGYGNRVRNGSELVTVTVTMGYFVDPGAAVVDVQVTLRLGLVQAVGLPGGAA
jgi:hypothetical protein